jgi:hypothetical protein
MQAPTTDISIAICEQLTERKHNWFVFPRNLNTGVGRIPLENGYGELLELGPIYR